MTALKMIFLSVLFGSGYLVVVSLLGGKITRLIWREVDQAGNLNDLVSPLLGVLVHVLVVSMMLVVAPRGIPWVLWLIVAVVALDWKNSKRQLAHSWKSLSIAVLYGLVCYAVLMSFHFGIARGDNLFWTVYNLTAITPGDSPQGLLQAQYLLHGQALQGLRDFSLFDRPFLGGLITLGALCGVGLPPGTVFNDFPPQQVYAYLALWVWLNSLFACVVVAVARRFASRGRHVVACILVLSAPFVVFNVIGAWPKLFAVYVICCAALLAIKGRWGWAVLFSGIAFLAHGSFLWAHLSLCGVLALYLLLKPAPIAQRLWQAGLVGLLAVAFPWAWFFAEHVVGAQTPLRTYYLYGVPVNYGMSHSMEGIAKGFYTSTTPDNIALLPFANTLKALLPQEMIMWLATFSYAGPNMDLRKFASALFYTQFNRPLFSFCLTAGIVALLGLRRELFKNWNMALAVSAFYLLPLIAGMGLYRRDDHFITPVMVFAVLPVLSAFCSGLNHLSRHWLALVITLVMGEFALVYWSRYPSVRYEGDFFEYYLWFTLGLLTLAFALAIRSALSEKDIAFQSAFHSKAGNFPGRIAPAGLLVASLMVVVGGGLLAPSLVQETARDGGFPRYGWNIDLARWSGITADRGNQTILHTDLRTMENGVEHGEMWINTGQAIVFHSVPATPATAFSAVARVHPAWNPESELPPLIFRTKIKYEGREAISDVQVSGARDKSGGWQHVLVDLSPFAGKNVDIEITPVSQTSGVWTLWRDPVVTIKP